MISKQEQLEIERIKKRIQAKKERIEKLQRLSKLKDNEDIISELDAIINQAENAIFAILNSKQLMPANEEQVVLHSNANVRLMAIGLKDSFINADKQIEFLNNQIYDDNQTIKEKETKIKTNGGKQYA